MNLVERGNDSERRGGDDDEPLVLNIRLLPFMFTGVLPLNGKGPYSLDSEFITLKPNSPGNKCENKVAEICLVSGSTKFECFFHALIYHHPDRILSYNTNYSGLTERKLRNGANFRFVQNQLKRILQFSNPLIVGCNLRSDFGVLNIEYKNIFDLHSFFYEYNQFKTGTQPISLRRLVFKFYGIDIQQISHDCITDALYTLRIYNEIYLKWKNISEKFSLKNPPFNHNEFALP